MKILLVNKFLYPKGGAETYVIKLGRILGEHGHQVQYFGLKNEKNTLTNEADAYVSHLDFSTGIRHNLTAPLRIIYNAEARRKIRTVLDAFQPDVVHLNNIQFHITPSILPEIHRYREQTGRKVKIIYTAHDYQLLCPSHGLFDSDMNVCEKCLGGSYLPCLKHKCVKNSRMKSLLGMLDAYFWKWNRAYSYIDTIICCSRFLKTKLDTQPRFRDKTVAIHNFVDTVQIPPVKKENYILQFGHLSRDKGTLTLLEAAKRLPDIPFVFAGFGPAQAEIDRVPNASYVGFQTGDELIRLVQKAALTVCASEIYENCPFSVIESQMYGTPVIGSRMGGIPELIREGQTGELFEEGDADALEQIIRKLWHDPALLERYTKNCGDLTMETAETYYHKLMELYT